MMGMGIRLVRTKLLLLPVIPTTTSLQSFCIQQNAALIEIAITGQSIKWYDALTNGNLLANTTPLQTDLPIMLHKQSTVARAAEFLF
jgi:hypothetical protein